MDGRAYNKLSDGKLIGVFNRTGRNILDFLKDYMPIYEGDTPPDLDGKTFDMSPLSVCFDFDGETSSRASGIVLTFGHWLSLGGANQDVRHYPYDGFLYLQASMAMAGIDCRKFSICTVGDSYQLAIR